MLWLPVGLVTCRQAEEMAGLAEALEVGGDLLGQVGGTVEEAHLDVSLVCGFGEVG